MSFYSNRIKLTERKIRIKIQANYIYLKNSNVKLHNIPFILGGYDYLKTRLAIDSNGNLIIDSVGYGVGAALFLFWSGTNTKASTYIYEKEYNSR